MNFAKRTDVWRREWDVAIKDLKKGLMDGVRLDVFFPGFPTLKHIPHTAKLSTAGVRVFEQPSRGQNTLLTLKGQGKPNVKDVAQELLGKLLIIIQSIKMTVTTSLLQEPRFGCPGRTWWRPR